MAIDFAVEPEIDQGRVKITANGGVPGDSFYILRRDRNGSQLVRETSEAGVVWQSNPASTRTNRASNPSLETVVTGWSHYYGSSGAQTVKNYATNPDMAPTTTDIEQARNRFPNPRFTGGSAGVPANMAAYLVGTVTGTRANTGNVETLSVTSMNAATRFGVYQQNIMFSGSANAPVTLKSHYVKTGSAALKVVMWADFYMGATNVGTDVGTIPRWTGTDEDIVIQVRPQGAYDRATIYFWVENDTAATVAVATTVTFSSPILATGQLAWNPELVNYFDGSSDADPDSVYSWAGTADASESIRTGKTIGQYVPQANTALAAVSPDGAYAAMAIMPGNSTVNDTYASLVADAGAVRLGLTPGNYVIRATATLLAAQKGTLHAKARSIAVYTKVGTAAVVETVSAAAPNAAGSTDLTLSFTVPTGVTEAYIRLYNGAFLGNGAVLWSQVGIYPSTYTGDNFSGATMNDPYTTFTWDGAANASSTTRSGINGRVKMAGAPHGSYVYQQSWGMNGTGGSPGPLYVESGLSGVAGDVWSAKLRVRSNVARTVKLLLRFRAVSTNITVFETKAFSVPANVWTELDIEGCKAGGAYDNILIWALPTYTAFAAGDWMQADRLLLESGQTITATNLIANPSFESGTAGVGFSSGMTVVTTTYAPMVTSGTQALNVTLPATTTAAQYVYQDAAVVAGSYFAFAQNVRYSSGSRYSRMRIDFFDASSVQVGGSQVSAMWYLYGTAGGDRHVFSALVPATAVKARCYVYLYNDAAGAVAPTGGSIFSTDAWLGVQAAAQADAETIAMTFFDGNSPGCSWTGTADISTSVQSQVLGEYFDGGTDNPAYSGWNGTVGNSTSYLSPQALQVQLFDYEARQGLDVDYVLTDELGNVGASKSLTIPKWGTWLKDPFRPFANVKLLWGADSEYTRKARRELFQPRGGKFPVPQWDVRVAPSGSVRVVTETTDQAIALTSMLDKAGVVMIDADADFGIPIRYVSIGDFSGARAGSDDDRNLTWEARIWTLQVDEVAYPVGAPVGQGFSYASVGGKFDSYIALAASVDSYNDLASGVWDSNV